MTTTAAYVSLRGTREVRHRLTVPSVQVPPPTPGKESAVYDDDAEDIYGWFLRYDDAALEALFGAPPMVASVELVSQFTGEAKVFFDANLLPDVSYELESTYFERATTFVGPRRSRRSEVRETELVLADIDAPLIRNGGRGDYTRKGGGDLLVTGGLATVEKLIWDRLLTPQGTRDWSPSYGSPLRLKALRPLALREEESRLKAVVEAVPGVSSAKVSVLFGTQAGDDHVIVSVRAQTVFGDLKAERGLS